MWRLRALLERFTRNRNSRQTVNVKVNDSKPNTRDDMAKHGNSRFYTDIKFLGLKFLPESDHVHVQAPEGWDVHRFVDALLTLRCKWDFSVSSWGRTPKHNKDVGGKATSKHQLWLGADLILDE